jgi:Fanconi anemia group M protein
MIGTSIIEEGLDIKSGAELAVFYDVVPSEIRTIQRRGRVGRTKAGKIIFLITNDTREQGYRWSAYNKEKKMKQTLQKMQEKTLKDY